MIDQTSIDLVQLVGGNLKRVAATNGGEYAGACPFCGGRDRFRVWPERGRWWCRQCERHGDALSFVQQREGFGFGEALRYLGLQGNEPTWSPAPRQPVLPEAVEPPAPAWQQAALAFVEQAEAALWGDYDRPLNWLRSRGFADDTLRQARVGYHAGVGPHGDGQYVARTAWGLLPDEGKHNLWLPRGIVIPWLVQGELWRVAIRRPVPDDAWQAVRNPPQTSPAPHGIAAMVLRCLREQHSYLTVRTLAQRCALAVADVQTALADLDTAKLVQPPTRHYFVPGSRNALYNADALQRGKPAMLVEAALDALAVQQEAGDLVSAVATGTTGARGIRWLGKLAGCTPMLLSYDNDQGGTAPTRHWRDVFREQAHVWRPYPDDPAAMLEHGFAVRGWIEAGLRHAGYAIPGKIDPITAARHAAAATIMNGNGWQEALAELATVSQEEYDSLCDKPRYAARLAELRQRQQQEVLSERAQAEQTEHAHRDPEPPAPADTGTDNDTPAPAEQASDTPAPPVQPVARTRPRFARNVEVEPIHLKKPNTSADVATVAATLDSSGIPAGWRWEPSRPYMLVHDASGQHTSMDVNKQRVIVEALSLALDWRIPRAYEAYEAYIAAEASEQEDA
jgi:DNA primase